MKIELVRFPIERDLLWMKQCAIGTMGKDSDVPPKYETVHKLLRARHSPIRELWFSYVLRDVPYWVTVHLVRHHVGMQAYVESQRNDRQNKYDRNKAPQDAPVTMRLSINAEALMNLANKRLCVQASPETRMVVREMCVLAEQALPELCGLLVPMCEYNGGTCYEIFPCGKKTKQQEDA